MRRASLTCCADWLLKFGDGRDVHQLQAFLFVLAHELWKGLLLVRIFGQSGTQPRTGTATPEYRNRDYRRCALLSLFVGTLLGRQDPSVSVCTTTFFLFV